MVELLSSIGKQSVIKYEKRMTESVEKEWGKDPLTKEAFIRMLVRSYTTGFYCAESLKLNSLEKIDRIADAVLNSGPVFMEVQRGQFQGKEGKSLIQSTRDAFGGGDPKKINIYDDFEPTGKRDD